MDFSVTSSWFVHVEPLCKLFIIHFHLVPPPVEGRAVEGTNVEERVCWLGRGRGGEDTNVEERVWWVGRGRGGEPACLIMMYFSWCHTHVHVWWLQAIKIITEWDVMFAKS